MRIIGVVILAFCSACSTLNKLNPWSEDTAEVESKNQDGSEESSQEDSSKEEMHADKKQQNTDGKKENKTGEEQKSNKDEKIAKHERRKSKAASIEELEKNQAELWAKLDGLKMHVSEQNQRVRVLEKAVTLGIVPDELRNDAKEDRLASAKTKALHKDIQSSHSEKNVDEKKSSRMEDVKKDASKKLSGDGRMVFEQKMVAAQEFFRAGRYGRAIAEYSSIQKEYKEFDTQGSSAFWLAMSWLNMKEYQSAQKSFESFMEEYSGSPLLPRASFYLARTEYALGFREKSQNRLRKIVADKPDDDAAEMARLELQQMRANL